MTDRPLKAVVVLEVMWDWNSMTSDAGYVETAPRWFTINPDNFTGSRLYQILGHTDFLVTNACPQLVKSAKGKGVPDKEWLKTNLQEIYSRWPYETVLVCGNVARDTFERQWLPANPTCKAIYMPHPAWRGWTEESLAHATDVIIGAKWDLNLWPDKPAKPRVNPCPNLGLLFEEVE